MATTSANKRILYGLLTCGALVDVTDRLVSVYADKSVIWIPTGDCTRFRLFAAGDPLPNVKKFVYIVDPRTQHSVTVSEDEHALLDLPDLRSVMITRDVPSNQLPVVETLATIDAQLKEELASQLRATR